MLVQAAQETLASAPFNDTATDIVLRSKDGVRFHVYKLLLSLTSPFFREMFTLPRPTPSNDNVDTIEVTEDSQTLDHLLRLCYPVLSPIIGEFTDVTNVLEAAVKYEMEKPTALMKVALLTFVNERPLQVYVVACRLRLEVEAKSAAGVWRTLCPNVYSKPNGSGDFPDWSSTPVAVSYLPETANISAGAYFRLLRFIRDGVDSNFVNADLRDNHGIPATTTTPIQPLNFEDSDIVLRSSDGIDFHVHKVIISLISSELLHGGSTVHDNLPVFNVTEDSQTLAMLLKLCYPNGNPDVVDLDSPAICTARVVFKIDSEATENNRFSAFIQNFARCTKTPSLTWCLD
jgi:hypothetical protein